MDVIVGTAGHIDHGKTSLVKALTGVDADRLPEEKQRGITIDIGFAELDLGDVHVGFVDVPGHERFVKNMLAGASGIDMVMLIVAADEGVMPQTREHFEICRLLETKNGIIVITKKDLVDSETVDLVGMEISEMIKDSFLAEAPCIAVSSRTCEGVSELKELLSETAQQIPNRRSDSVTRLPIDRSFSVKGFGAVVTGTLASGDIREAQELELLPVGINVRVRGVQTHGKIVETARAGQRTAINLGGIDHEEVSRGMVLVEAGSLRPTQIIDTQVEVLSDAKSPLRSRQRVRFHIGTVEALARVDVLNDSGEIEPGKTGFVQIRLESPIVTVPDERFIIRQYSPQVTVAGGRVIDNLASKHKKKDFEYVRGVLENLLVDDAKNRLQVLIETSGEAGIGFAGLMNRTGLRRDVLESLVEGYVEGGLGLKVENFLVARAAFDRLKQKTLNILEKFHSSEPLSKGMPMATLKEKGFAQTAPQIFKSLIDALCAESKIEAEKDVVRARSKKIELSAEESDLKDFFYKSFESAGLEVPKFEELMKEAVSSSRLRPEHARKVFQLLLDSNDIVKVSEDFYFKKDALEDLVKKLRDFAAISSDRSIDVPKFKDVAGVSRKYAIPLLEHFDREKITRRVGDKRVIL